MPAETASLAMRSELMIAIKQRVRRWGLTQAKAATRLGVTQSRLNDLLRGKLGHLSRGGLRPPLVEKLAHPPR
jgi:predicted XRE-type DNA-binding protein